MSDEDAVQIQGPWVIVCEGDADKFFFRKLLALNNIHGVDTPFPVNPDQGGFGWFASCFTGARAIF
jgi:hypothetical protein